MRKEKKLHSVKIGDIYNKSYTRELEIIKQRINFLDVKIDLLYKRLIKLESFLLTNDIDEYGNY